MDRRRSIRALLALACVARWASAHAGGVARVGVLIGVSRANGANYLLLPAALRELGWIEGRDIAFEWRFADGDTSSLARLAAQLLEHKPALVVVQTNVEAQAVLSATRAMPLIVWTALDPVGSGLANTLAHPGRSVTGLLWADPGLAAKMVDILHETAPPIRRLVLLHAADYPGMDAYADADRAVAAAKGLEFRSYAVESARHLASVLDTLTSDRDYGIKAAPTGAVFAGLDSIIAFAAAHRVPSIFTAQYAIDRGGLLAYSPSVPEVRARVASLADKVLRGADPSDLPFEHPTRFELGINLKTAVQLGIDVPASVLLRADRVIR